MVGPRGQGDPSLGAGHHERLRCGSGCSGALRFRADAEAAALSTATDGSVSNGDPAAQQLRWDQPSSPAAQEGRPAAAGARAPLRPRYRAATILASGLGGLTVGVSGLALLADSHTVQLLGAHVAALPPEGRSVVLSFDDGPNPGSTERILAVLRDRGVPASFFLIGERIERYPRLAARIEADGHQLGNHSYSHPRMVLERPGSYSRELDRTDRLIRALGYRGTIDFRAPYGQKLVVLPWLLSRRGKVNVLWSVDSRDWIDPDPASIARRVVRKVRPGSIVLLHDLPRTAAALPLILDGLQQRGYHFRTVRPVTTSRTTQAAAGSFEAGPQSPAGGQSRR